MIRLFYAFNTGFALLLWLPIFYEFQKGLGLSDSQIFGIQSAYYLMFCLLEIPTGALADRIGYKSCVSLGALVLVIANAIPIFAGHSLPAYTAMFTHFALIALARSLVSGAASAYLYEWLQERGQTALYRGVEGRARSLSLIAKVVSWPTVGWMMSLEMTLPYAVSAVASLASLGFALAMPRLKPKPPRPSETSQLQDLWRLFPRLARHPLLIWVMVQGLVDFTLSRIFQINLFQPLLGSRGIDPSWFGWILSAVTLLEALGAARPEWARRTFRFWGELGTATALAIGLSLSVALTIGTGPWGAIAGLALFSFGTGMYYPIQRGLMNEAIPDSRYRATFLSMESLLDRAFCAWVAALAGGFVGGGQLSLFLGLLAAAGFAVSVATGLLRR